MVIVAAFVAMGFHHVYYDRTNLPDIGAFNRFEFPTIGTIYDANGRQLMELAKERRRITPYEEIPSIVRDAILAAEDKNYFTLNGIDYFGILRGLTKIKIGKLAVNFIKQRTPDQGNHPVIFPQGGSTITQQLVRDYFLKNLTALEYLTAEDNTQHLRKGVLLPRMPSWLVGPRNANMCVRKIEEIRLSLWVENEMQAISARNGALRKKSWPGTPVIFIWETLSTDLQLLQNTILAKTLS